jgi:hypothetical protein
LVYNQAHSQEGGGFIIDDDIFSFLQAKVFLVWMERLRLRGLEAV